MNDNQIPLLFQTTFSIREILDWTLHHMSVRGALAMRAYYRWRAEGPEKAQEYAHSWTAEIEINDRSVLVSLYPEEWDEQA